MTVPASDYWPAALAQREADAAGDPIPAPIADPLGIGGTELLLASGAMTEMRRRRARARGWRAVWSIWGPVLPLALAAGMLAGVVLAMLRWQP